MVKIGRSITPILQTPVAAFIRFSGCGVANDRNQGNHPLLHCYASIRLWKNRKRSAQLRLQILCAKVARGQQHGELGAVPKDPACEGNAVMAPGHLNIRKDASDGTAISFEYIQSLVCTAGLKNHIATAGQVIGEVQANARIIFDHKNRQGRADITQL